jgi:hypothetical protein
MSTELGIIDQWLYETLTGDVTVAAAVGSRVYADVAPAGATYPCVVKNGYEYKGKMIKVDGHMNILLEGANELKDEQLMTNYGNVLLRGNNILYIVLNANIH